MSKSSQNFINEHLRKRGPNATIISIMMAMILFMMIVVDVSPAFAGFTWTAQTAAGSRDWIAIASSSDGSKLAAAVDMGYIYTSTDSGATWTGRTGSGSHRWNDITSIRRDEADRC